MPGTQHSGALRTSRATGSRRRRERRIRAWSRSERPERYATLEETIAAGGLHVVLDGIEDPHNLGAIIRTAHAAGAAAVVIPERRAAGSDRNGGARRGRSARRICRWCAWPISIARSNELKEAGYWIYGLDERGQHRLRPGGVHRAHRDRDRRAKGTGLHEHVAKHCDFLVRIPMPGGVASLNVSVAAGVVLFEWKRKMSANEREPN